MSLCYSFDYIPKPSGADRAELFRNNLLRIGQTSALLYPNGEIDAELYAIQLATAAAIGKPFGGFVPARPMSVCICGCGMDLEERQRLHDAISSLWTSEGWTREEIDRAMRSTLFFDPDRRWEDDYSHIVRTMLRNANADLIIVCDTISAYGEDTENPRIESFAQFLQQSLKARWSCANPCAVLALVKLDDADPMISAFVKKCESGSVDRQLEQEILGSTRGRAVSEWARRIFVLGRIELGSSLNPIVLGCLRHDPKLIPWSSARFGRGALGHAMRFRDGLFQEIRLESIKDQTARELIAEGFSCADTIGQEIKS